MGTLTNNKNKRNPQSQPSHGSNHIAKKPKSSSSSKPSRKNSVSRLHLYPDHKTPIKRQIQAPCTIISGFNSTQKRFSQNMRKKSSLVDKGLFLEYFRTKELAIESCRHVKFENLEQCDDGVEVIDVDNGNVGDSGNVVEVIDVDEEESIGSGEVEEIRAKYKKLNQLSDVKVGSSLHKKLDGLVERRGPSLRKLRFEIKLKELKQKSCQKPCPVKKEEEEELYRKVLGMKMTTPDAMSYKRDTGIRLEPPASFLCYMSPTNELPSWDKCTKIHWQKGDEQKDVVHDLFTPLMEEEEKMVATALSYSNRKKVLVNHEKSNIMITGEALQCLRPHAWLNDEVINIYLELLKDRERREPKKFLKCHFFNTFFYKKLVGGRTRTGYDYESVKRWTAQKKLGYGLDECDKIFVPIHKEIHWCLAVINKKDKKFQYLDSLGGTDKKVLRALAKYLTDEVKDKTGKIIDVTSWEQEYVTDLPNQENGYDCGMFMIKYIDFYSRDVGLCFSQDDMPYFRKRTAKEILRLRAN